MSHGAGRHALRRAETSRGHAVCHARPHHSTGLALATPRPGPTAPPSPRGACAEASAQRASRRRAPSCWAVCCRTGETSTPRPRRPRRTRPTRRERKRAALRGGAHRWRHRYAAAWWGSAPPSTAGWSRRAVGGVNPNRAGLGACDKHRVREHAALHEVRRCLDGHSVEMRLLGPSARGHPQRALAHHLERVIVGTCRRGAAAVSSQRTAPARASKRQPSI